jgi:hypothetical protein
MAVGHCPDTKSWEGMAPADQSRLKPAPDEDHPRLTCDHPLEVAAQVIVRIATETVTKLASPVMVTGACRVTDSVCATHDVAATRARGTR